uniref:Uncharacterized protein n=1 Tax=Marseillevirus sp. TaxID=2809551 RepID=A0AA96J3G5_9VIRU|nr:hypothetical protein MarDSR_001 [Marseillevirus sp.]
MPALPDWKFSLAASSGTQPVGTNVLSWTTDAGYSSAPLSGGTTFTFPATADFEITYYLQRSTTSATGSAMEIYDVTNAVVRYNFENALSTSVWVSCGGSGILKATSGQAMTLRHRVTGNTVTLQNYGTGSYFYVKQLTFP